MPTILINILTVLAVMMAGFFALVRYLETVGVFFPSRDMAVNPVSDGLALGGCLF